MWSNGFHGPRQCSFGQSTRLDWLIECDALMCYVADNRLPHWTLRYLEHSTCPVSNRMLSCWHGQRSGLLRSNKLGLPSSFSSVPKVQSPDRGSEAVQQHSKHPNMPDRCEKEQTGATNSNLWTAMPSSTRLTRSQFQAHDAIWNRQGSSGHTARPTPASPPAGRHGTGPGHLFTLSAPAAAVGPSATSMPTAAVTDYGSRRCRERASRTCAFFSLPSCWRLTYFLWSPSSYSTLVCTTNDESDSAPRCRARLSAADD